MDVFPRYYEIAFGFRDAQRCEFSSKSEMRIIQAGCYASSSSTLTICTRDRALRSRMLEVGDYSFVYWETCGNPRGKRTVVLQTVRARDARGGIAGSSIRRLKRSFSSISGIVARSTPHAECA